MIGTICVWKLKERIEQDRRNSLIKRWHWKCSQTDTWFSSKNFLNTLKLFFFIFSIYLIENSKMSQKNIFFFIFYCNFQPQFCPVNHTQFYFCYWNHQRLLETFISYEKFVFSWLCPEESVIKPSEIAIFGLKMTYIRYRNRPLWTTPIFKLEFFSRYCYRI